MLQTKISMSDHSISSKKNLDTLEAVQARFFDVITGKTSASLAGTIKSGVFLNADACTQIYSRAYFARLIRCLSMQLPALKYAVSDGIFEELVIGYLKKYPPQSYTLNDLPNDLVTYLQAERPDARLPLEEHEPWFDFLVELAEVETNYLAVLDAAEMDLTKQQENSLRSILQSSYLSSDTQEFIFTKASRPIALQYPSHTYVKDVRANHSPALPCKEQAYMITGWVQYETTFIDLHQEQYNKLLQFWDAF